MDISDTVNQMETRHTVNINVFFKKWCEINEIPTKDLKSRNQHKYFIHIRKTFFKDAVYQGFTRRQISEVVGFDPSVITRHLNKKVIG
jgi:hypothetical protein